MRKIVAMLEVLDSSIFESQKTKLSAGILRDIVNEHPDSYFELKAVGRRPEEGRYIITFYKD